MTDTHLALRRDAYAVQAMPALYALEYRQDAPTFDALAAFMAEVEARS